MKKILACIFACILAVTLLSACSAGTSSNVIKIGINYELSGGAATYGQSSVEGIEMAIEEINKAGGINGKLIKTVKYDNKSESSEAATLANKLVSQDKVLAILGPATTGCFTSQIPVANKNKIPIATGSATGDKLTLAPDGSVVKRSAVADEMLRHRGPARVFDSEDEAIEAIYNGRINRGDVVIIRYEGPKGGPGMREMLGPTSAIAGMPFINMNIQVLEKLKK